MSGLPLGGGGGGGKSARARIELLLGPLKREQCKKRDIKFRAEAVLFINNPLGLVNTVSYTSYIGRTEDRTEDDKRGRNTNLYEVFQRQPSNVLRFQTNL